MTIYRYSNLSAALRDKDSPLSTLLRTTLPNTRVVQAEYRKSEPELLVDGGSANPGTVGGAFDYAMRFELSPTYDGDLAKSAFLGFPTVVAEIDALIVAAQAARGNGDQETVYRASWALALLTEVYRVGLMPGSPLFELASPEAMTAKNLLGLAGEDALRQLRSLTEVARRALVPNLNGPYRLGPTFDGSTLCAADADVIAADLLLDFKTSLGAKVSRPGGRSDRLDVTDLYQLVSYALFDRSNTYGIGRVGIYSARFGHLVSWDLQQLLDTLAGTPIKTQALRDQVWLALGGR
ncbi:hypothetical protein [Microbacterium sp. Leaf320]|uniref:hypothetical protein n=1 Tax=Microbacterium sp. Leaf320 TaxID=1736334 RepID=UPI0006FF2B5E|nr:hypothetical protein [Microbacterium sp. Leaf320]KQQ68461.1 hypothetical protein ASF63_00125 [Microbacterium sp. Leaf320]